MDIPGVDGTEVLHVCNLGLVSCGSCMSRIAIHIVWGVSSISRASSGLFSVNLGFSVGFLSHSRWTTYETENLYLNLKALEP